MLNIKKFWKAIRIVPKTSTEISAQGEIEVLSTDGKARYHNGTTVSPIVTEAHSATLTNKTVVVANNTITTAASGNLTSTELNASLAELQSDIDTRNTNITVKDEGGTLTSTMTSIDFVGAGVTATNTGNAITVTVNSGGDVVGPASSVDSEVALFNSTTGKLLKRATGTGVAHLTSGVLSASNVALTSEVTGVLPLANGGTNKNMTAVAGGIVYTDADSQEVTAAGTAGQILQSNGASAPTWANPSTVSSQFAYRSVTTTDTATTADYTLELSGASFTQNLYTAVGNTGKILEIIHRGTSVSQVYTVDGNGSETIDGTTTYVLYTNSEKIKIQSNGTNWILLDHKTSTPITSGTITLTATSVNPTKGTISTDLIEWTREGRYALINMIYHQTAAGTSGTGEYLIALPSGLTMDSAKVTYNTSTDSNGANGATNLGFASGGAGATLSTQAAFVPYDSTHVRVVGLIGGSANRWQSAGLPLSNTIVRMGGQMKVPIDQWRD